MIQSPLLAALEAAFQSAVTAEVESQLTGIRQHCANTVGELAAKVAALETKLTEAQLFQRTTSIDVNAATDALNQQEWFWQKVGSFVEERAAQEFNAEAMAESLSDEQLRHIARRVSPSDIASSVDWSEEIDYSEITSALDFSELANEINYSELSSDIDAAQWANQLDLDERLRDILSGRTVTIQL